MAVFLEVIEWFDETGRTLMHRIDGQFLADRCGDEQEWNVRRVLAREGQRRHAVETRNGIIGENEVEVAGLEGGDKIAAGVHTMSGAFEPRLR